MIRTLVYNGCFPPRAREPYMAQLVGNDEIESLRVELAEIGRSLIWGHRFSAIALVSEAFQDCAKLPGLKSQEAKITIIDDVSGIIKPGRTTLLLGPPGCGKGTLLKALSGKLSTSLKEISVEGHKTTFQTDFILKYSFNISDIDLPWLDICAYTLIGDAMRRGISGGQKKRGEMIVGPTKSLFMDEISNGLDSSTTYQIVACLQQLAHITDATILVALLQPAPETFDLFDDIILMAEGKIVYHGACSHVLEFFEDCGFRCSERKGVAHFLQEVISKKDQAQYWHQTEQSRNYISADMFSKKFKESPFGKKLDEELSKPFSKPHNHKNTISFSKYSLSKWALIRACMSGELLLMGWNSFIYVFKSAQLVIIASVAMTVFLRTRMNLSLTVGRLAVFYKQRDLYFYPAWAYAIPATILKVPISLFSALIWTSLTYYVVGYSPEAGRFFLRFIIFLALHLAATFMFRFVASVFRTAEDELKLQDGKRPGVLTALMGVSGVVKTTLMDVLAGRKTSGTIEGDNRIGGFPKVHETFARISGYCEQTDIHSPQITVEESVVYSVWLSLCPEIDSKTKFEFVKEVLEIIEFDEIKDFGMPGPTTGLDARAAAIVMRAVKNVAETGRTIVCTIHQPSIDIFEAFGELILLKASGQVIYSGPLGQHSSSVIEYFVAISGVQMIINNYNPATWTLQITSRSAEAQLCTDFVQVYKNSVLYQNSKEHVNRCSTPPPGSNE
ncbi:hypothetical protein TEA_028352 [Camellia sinensis var. sinensis]|uniref:ABC transporter domain-containing protein n=1 Tax=Camellia sinensis var. sinensis TaxID=542762 RepID=A0A4S4DM44_CAMSN|nr:hypothetical protein TEA_028352 [Camellia sinensis var. sinensis]